VKIVEAKLYTSPSKVRRSAIVQLRTDGGLRGLGEMAIHFGSRESPRSRPNWCAASCSERTRA
jgi:L-alanine-DL-glutamate epimerase-like enolase superfamily enzyme